ncbi:Pycsar system effector family protein [Streptomyces jumonjinensis]|uniref:Pycsar system effector family protein n=1 Tax=Streptomyces jumonjinensis TaxID=1945 RepID=UPI0037AA03D4
MTTTEPQTTTATDAQLAQARADVITEIIRTDTKAAALLAAFGIPFAVLIAALPGRDVPGPAAVLLGLGVVGLVAAMLVVLLVVRPRLGARSKPRNRGSFLYWATCTTAEEILTDLAADHRPQRIITLSQIAEKKYRSLAVAVDVTAGAVVLLALGLLAGIA